MSVLIQSDFSNPTTPLWAAAGGLPTLAASANINTYINIPTPPSGNTSLGVWTVTAPAEGTFVVKAVVWFANTIADSDQVTLLIDGTSVTWGGPAIQAAGAGYWPVPVSYVFPGHAAASHTIEFRATHSATTGTCGAAATLTVTFF